MSLIDLTHKFTAGMPVFPGDKTPGFSEVANVAEHGYNAIRLETGMHVGTHMDAPLHMFAEGKKLNDYPIDYFTGTGRVLDMSGKSLAAAEMLEEIAHSDCEILLVRSGWSSFFGDEKYYTDYPEISPDFARALTQTKIRIIGLDWPSPDRAPYDVHRILLGNDILIIENLKDLDRLPIGRHFQVYAFPYTYELEGSPVRVVAGLT